jgi:hypothetical protein
MSIELNFWFGSHKDLEISGPSGRRKSRSIDCISLDRSRGYPGSIDRIFAQSISVRLMNRSIVFFSQWIFDWLNYLSWFFFFSGSTLNSENDQIALDVFSGIIQVFWTSFQLRPENKTKDKITTKYYIYNTN